VVIARLERYKVVAIDKVNQSMFFINSPGPTSR
jgi:hypothetical protein